jgi:malate synthase
VLPRNDQAEVVRSVESGELTFKPKGIAMKKHLIVLNLCGALTGSVMLAEVKAQEQKHEEHQAGKTVSNKNAAEPAKADGMKCCEGMEKMGEMKAGMPMKSEMKAKMMEKMKEKMADKAQEKKSPDLPAKGQAEKSQTNTDAHQH